MEEYRTYTLEELSIGKGNYGIAASAVPFSSSLRTYLRITDINDDGSLNKSGLMSVDEDDADNYLLKPNDIVFARTGNSTGRSYFYDGSDGDLVYAGFLIKFSLDSTKVNPRILKYYTHSKLYYGWVQSFNSGSTRGNINAKTYGNMPITLPPRDIQDKIVSILKSLDDKIAVNRRICENLEAQAQALFKHWFIDFAPFLDKPSGKAERKNGKFVESELGMIPEGWRVGKLEELCSFISRGLSPKYQQGTNELVLGQTCVRNNIVTLNNAREHQPKANCNRFVEKWDVLLNSTGIGSLGRVGIVYFNKNNVCFDSHLTVVRTAEDIYRYYVGRNLLNRQKELENMAVGSTGQTELPKKDVLVMPILIPNSDVLPIFNEIIENIGNKIYTLIEENFRLSTLRDTLLPKLMSGQIKVNEIEKGL